MKTLKSLAVITAGGALALAVTAASAQMVNSPGTSAWTPSGDVVVHNASGKAQATRSTSAAGKADIFGRPQVHETANEVYFNADPFAPLPQLQSMYQARIASPAPQIASK